MANSQVCILLVGNKTDLEEQRKIKLDFAHKVQSCLKFLYSFSVSVLSMNKIA